MKKFLAVMLAALMLFSLIPMAAFAAVDADDDLIVDALLDEDNYYHIEYVENKDYFSAEIAYYSSLNLYKDAWDNMFTGSVDTDYAKTILLALIERFEAEYNNETFEEIVAVLDKASSVADLMEKVNEYTGVLDFVESSEWSTSITILNDAIKVAEYGNTVYEKFVEGYAVILSAQAASSYYANFLNYIAENCANEAAVAAATELATIIVSDMDTATKALAEELAAEAAGDLAEFGVNIAMDAYSVTAIIKKVYNTVGSLADKLFNTSEKYKYISSLATVVAIEDVMPAYMDGVFAADDDFEVDFAVSSLLTIRETGEELLLNLENVTEDSVVGKLFANYNTPEILVRTGIQAAKLSVMRNVLTAETGYKAASIVTAYGPAAMEVSANAAVVATVADSEESYVYGEYGAFASIYCEETESYVKVAVLFGDNDYSVKFAGTANGQLDVAFDTAAAGDYDVFFFQNKFISTARDITITSSKNWTGAPAYVINDATHGAFNRTMDADYVSANANVADNTAPVDPTAPVVDEPEEEKKTGFAAAIKAFFENLIKSFTDIFANLFKK